ncbi:MAG: hypothetical protein IME93_05185 [Proteobacteria bacterium]|nr:hypothetical protein [Pseudomonadota bacterium]
MCKKCWIVVSLLLLIIAGGAYKFLIQGAVEQSSDGRMAIKLNEAERNLVLEEMRGFLASTQQIVAAANKKDIKQIIKSARAVGKAAQAAVPGSLMGKLPMEFKKLGFDTHTKFDLLAMNVEELEDEGQAMTQLAELLQNCVACHASYRIDLESK